MDDSEGGRKLPRGAASDLWRNTLSRIPSLLGRLVYLSSLRDPNSGRYYHHGLAQLFGDREADQTLRQSHVDTFASWLLLRLEEQKQELEDYLSTLPEDRATVAENWLRMAPYRSFLPAEARETDRRLFESDLAVVLEILRHESAGGGPARGASPRP